MLKCQYIRILKSHSLCRFIICHSSYEIWDQNIKRQKVYDRLNIGIMWITVYCNISFSISIHCFIVLKGPFLRLGINYKKEQFCKPFNMVFKLNHLVMRECLFQAFCFVKYLMPQVTKTFSTRKLVGYRI